MLPGTATNWDDLLQWKGTWAYRVTAHFVDGSQAFSGADYVYPEPQAPVVTVRQAGPGAVVLSWQAVPNASYYVVGGPPSNVAFNVNGASVSFNGVPSGVQSWKVSTTYDPDGIHRAGSEFTDVSVNVAIRGFADVHNHQFANLGFGGKAFVGSPFGPIEQALPWCTDAHGLGGLGDALGNAVKASYGNGIFGHKVGGFDQFDGWPRWDSVTHQSVYEDWLLRAHQGGLQLMVMLAVNNEFLCNQANRAQGRSCNDTEAVKFQIDGANRMEAHIDDKSGGAGKGWYRIVRTPAEARRAIDQGQLAVVLGVEVDKPVCDGTGPCTLGSMLNDVDDLYLLGVRHLFPIHFQNNAIGGASFDKALDGSPDALDPTLVAAMPHILAVELAKPYQFHTQKCALAGGYMYSWGRCNAEGLTSDGRIVIRSLMSRGMVIDVDHMSEFSFFGMMNLAEPTRYPVNSGHTGFVEISNGDKAHEGNMTAMRVEAIRRNGGMVSIIPSQGGINEINTWDPHNGQTVVRHTCGNSSETIAQAYLYAVTKMQGGPVGFGTDMNGFAGLPGPRYGSSTGGPDESCSGGKNYEIGPLNRVAYPFNAFANGSSMDRSVIGQKRFDINEDGLAHIGMLPDLIADFQNLGIKGEELEPLMKSAEGYIAMWERALASAPPPVENVACPSVRKAVRNVSVPRLECVAGTGAYAGQGLKTVDQCFTPEAIVEDAAKVQVLNAQATQLACLL